MSENVKVKKKVHAKPFGPQSDRNFHLRCYDFSFAPMS